MQRGRDEEIGGFWRRLHQIDHLLKTSANTSNSAQRRNLHRFAGHLARSKAVECRTAVRTRCLAWWRHTQKRHFDKSRSVHPARFKAWRWEAQLVEFYGETESIEFDNNVGWMLEAQNRESWRKSEKKFATS